MKNYRIVMFDYLSFGNNPRTGENRVDITKIDDVEEWLIEYWERWVEKVDLPDKFYLAGHSFGGYQSALYASRHPDRIKKVFFISPANFETFDPKKEYDIYSFRTDDRPNPPPRWLVRK
jgi:pimeloyl-ACP methyl ester carboxylesterase